VLSVAVVKGDDHNNDQNGGDGGEAPSNEDDGGEGGAFSIFDFCDVFSSFGCDPAGNNEGHQLLEDAASSDFRRSDGNTADPPEWLLKSARV
jgi:hypothetical protein